MKNFNDNIVFELTLLSLDNIWHGLVSETSTLAHCSSITTTILSTCHQYQAITSSLNTEGHLQIWLNTEKTFDLAPRILRGITDTYWSHGLGLSIIKIHEQKEYTKVIIPPHLALDKINYFQRQLASSDMVAIHDEKDVSILFCATGRLSLKMFPNFLPSYKNYFGFVGQN